MRHRIAGRKLRREPGHRKALFKNLVTALFEHGAIVTTTAKAKAVRPMAERLITFARRGTLASRRHVNRFIQNRDVVKKLFDEIAPRYVDRPGGYTRILKRVRGLGKNRLGDNAQTCLFELVGGEAERHAAKKEKAAEKKKSKEKTPAVPHG